MLVRTLSSEQAGGQALASLLQAVQPTPAEAAAIDATTRELLERQRRADQRHLGSRLFRVFGLESEEGLALLQLAEAYPRIPDQATAARLLAQCLRTGTWHTPSARAEGWPEQSVRAALRLGHALTRAPGPCAHWLCLALRPVMLGGLSLLAHQYIADERISSALARLGRTPARGDSHGSPPTRWRYSFDMLGESAVTAADAQRYRERYHEAIVHVGRTARRTGSAQQNDGISIKLSALDPRFESLQRAHCVPRLIGVVGELAHAARDRHVGLTIDAEETERLEPLLEVLAGVIADRSLADWDGLGVAVQAYQRRAPHIIEWLEQLAAQRRVRLTVRLVKGAYWDGEIKRAQELGLPRFPVWTRKAVTDLSYLACARRLLQSDHLAAAFATHNAQTAATLLQWCAERRDWEFQRLYGMGEGLYESLVVQEGVHCRLYAPVGEYAELLPYLVRRLLENGANAGWLRQLATATDVHQLVQSPLAVLAANPHPESEVIVNPLELFPGRHNASGLDLSDRADLHALLDRLSQCWTQRHEATALIGGRPVPTGPLQPLRDPADVSRVVGQVAQASTGQVREAFDRAVRAQPAWASAGVSARAACLRRAADLLETRRELLMALLVREAGRSLPDALSEVREAIDFCRYYAEQAERWMAPMTLPGPTGEHNELRWEPRGVFACISPWNFPLAIFLGQVSAALVCGNAVLAKPAPQTPLVAAAAVRLLLEAGVPPDVIALLPGGDEIGAALIADRRLAGVAFTGSTVTARRIARRLLEDDTRPLVPLLAETGGINAMIVDSSALLQRMVSDVMTSAFQSAGQRCSALRLLCLQQDIAEPALQLLIGAMQQLRVGDPADPATDVGPLIDEEARRAIEDYVAALPAEQILYRTPLPAGLRGHFVSPTLVHLTRVEDLQREVFGPVLHVVRWQSGQLPCLLERINASGYGLTMGLQTRLEAHIESLRAHAQVGNLYVNRSMIGAVVGSQPFGGERLSGTGPKAGGPHYLLRFMTERTVTINTAAVGADVELARKAI